MKPYLKLTHGKRIIAFIDGDRAGDLILKELQGLVKIDKVYRAPPGREVEEVYSFRNFGNTKRC